MNDELKHKWHRTQAESDSGDFCRNIVPVLETRKIVDGVRGQRSKNTYFCAEHGVTWEEFLPA